MQNVNEQNYRLENLQQNGFDNVIQKEILVKFEAGEYILSEVQNFYNCKAWRWYPLLLKI